MWRRRQSLQASGGTAPNQEVCGARASPNGAARTEQESGEMHSRHFIYYLLLLLLFIYFFIIYLLFYLFTREDFHTPPVQPHQSSWRSLQCSQFNMSIMSIKFLLSLSGAAVTLTQNYAII